MRVSKEHIRVISMKHHRFLGAAQNVSITQHFADRIFRQAFNALLTEKKWSVAEAP
jgi:hypothetical protein